MPVWFQRYGANIGRFLQQVVQLSACYSTAMNIWRARAGRARGGREGRAASYSAAQCRREEAVEGIGVKKFLSF